MDLDKREYWWLSEIAGSVVIAAIIAGTTTGRESVTLEPNTVVQLTTGTLTRVAILVSPYEEAARGEPASSKTPMPIAW